MIFSKKIFKRFILIIILLGIAIFGLFFFQNHKDRYDGISLENTHDISEALRGALIRRSWRLRIDFSAYTADKDAVRDIVSQIYEESLYDSQNPKGGDYLRFQCGGYQLDYSVKKRLFKYDYHLSVMPDYYTTEDQEEMVDEMVADIVASSGLTDSSDDYEKIRFVHDYICENVAYDTVHKHTPGSEHIQSTAYGTLYYKTALCQGYAVLSYRLLKELGIDNRIVTGYVRVTDIPEKHAWNIVCLDGRYYNMDVTLDDVKDTDDYFLKSDISFEKDHDRDEKYKTDDFTTVYIMSESDR